MTEDGTREGVYCSTNDLLIGDLPLPSYISAAKFVNDAADEIDSMIGFRYETPIDVSASSAVVKPARNLLKRMNAHIATARIIMALDMSGEDNAVHAYALKLLSDALAALKEVAKGTFIFDGAEAVDGSENAENTAPRIANVDAESNVEAFYDRIANPYYVYRSPDSERSVTTYGNGIVL